MYIPAVRWTVNRFYFSNVVRQSFFDCNFWSLASFRSNIFKKRQDCAGSFFWNDTMSTSRQFILLKLVLGSFFTKSEQTYSSVCATWHVGIYSLLVTYLLHTWSTSYLEYLVDEHWMNFDFCLHNFYSGLSSTDPVICLLYLSVK